nr:MAG: hypothetical protein [Bacteriophage sp.]
MNIGNVLVEQSSLIKEVERKLSIIPKEKPNIIVITVGEEEKVRTKKVEIVKDRWSDGYALEISHNGWQTTSIGNLDLEDLKKIRKVIRKEIRRIQNENNKSI